MLLEIVLGATLALIFYAILRTMECDEKVERILTVAIAVGFIGWVYLLLGGHLR